MLMEQMIRTKIPPAILQPLQKNQHSHSWNNPTCSQTEKDTASYGVDKTEVNMSQIWLNEPNFMLIGRKR